MSQSMQQIPVSMNSLYTSPAQQMQSAPPGAATRSFGLGAPAGMSMGPAPSSMMNPGGLPPPSFPGGACGGSGSAPPGAPPSYGQSFGGFGTMGMPSAGSTAPIPSMPGAGGFTMQEQSLTQHSGLPIAGAPLGSAPLAGAPPPHMSNAAPMPPPPGAPGMPFPGPPQMQMGGQPSMGNVGQMMPNVARPQVVAPANPPVMANNIQYGPSYKMQYDRRATSDKTAVKYTGFLPLEGVYEEDTCRIG